METTNDFVKINIPNDSDVCLKDCKIDLMNKEQKLTFKQCTDEYDMWYDLNH